ncbi:hypothetical protein NFI96_009937 [Prochilodus magdalenae]|nr:hypothetical protein NFI96_009937 [Prochilodus magdalenae]
MKTLLTLVLIYMLFSKEKVPSLSFSNPPTMKALLTLVFIYMLFSEDLQPSAALSCYDSGKSSCNAVTCNAGQDRCYTASGKLFGLTITAKGCTTSALCTAGAATGKMTCCEKNMCNSAEGVKMSLLMALLCLISSTLFI